MVAALRDDDLEAPMFALGEWLADRRGLMDRSESTWLGVLADFDRAEGYAADGALSAADWLMWRCGMARSTAFEKLRIAHQLARRALVAAAFAAGEISYSAVRAITRIDDPPAEVEAALVALAAEGTIVELEAAVRHYQALADQEAGPEAQWRALERRGVRLQRGFGERGRAELILENLELEEFALALEAFIDRRAVDESSAADSGPAGQDASAPVEIVPWWERRADAFMEMVRVALAHAGEGHAVGAERYTLHVVAEAGALIDGRGRAHLLDGRPLQPSTLARLACDSSVVAHLVQDGTEPLALGRKARRWSVAQRRAIAVRDGGRCRFPGCGRSICDIHHLSPWAEGGPTDLDNGAMVCTRHHSLLHRGFRAEGNANRTLRFYRPDGSLIATSEPPRPTSGPLRLL
jgi:hypothetical protein